MANNSAKKQQRQDRIFDLMRSSFSKAEIRSLIKAEYRVTDRTINRDFIDVADRFVEEGKSIAKLALQAQLLDIQQIKRKLRDGGNYALLLKYMRHEAVLLGLNKHYTTIEAVKVLKDGGILPTKLFDIVADGIESIEKKLTEVGLEFEDEPIAS